MTPEEETRNVKVMIDKFFERLRDDVGRPLTDVEVIYLVTQLNRHIGSYKGQ